MHQIRRVNDPEVRKALEEVETLPRPRGNRSGNKKRYKNAVTAFDIETTRLKWIEQSIMYIWQFQLDDQMTIIGRTWDEFLELAAMLDHTCNEDEMWIVYVHNLSYEFQFLAGIYPFSAAEVFAIDRRKVLKCTMFDHIELRCSYIHSNMSLDEYTHKFGVDYAKLSGYDYSKLRFPWTELTESEMEYCINDVLGLVSVLKKEMEIDGDNLYTIPLTSTGYVRRDIKRAMKTYNWELLSRQLPTMEIYQMLSEAFRGGNTHANRYFTRQIIGSDELPYRVQSYDRSSSYPDVQCNELYPVGRWTIERDIDINRLDTLVNLRKKACLMRVVFTNIRMKEAQWPVPYLSISKVREFAPMKKYKDRYGNWRYPEVYDNGRIMASRCLKTTITDIDLKIILDEYQFDEMHIETIAHCTYGKLPNQMTDQILEYYKRKTELKGVESMDIFYMKSKNKLNSIYGMTVQNPVKRSILFEIENLEEPFKEYEESTDQELLQASNARAFLNYAWGVWTTAWARYALELGIRAAHDPKNGSYVAYCDTDSVKWFADNEEAFMAAIARFEAFNKEAIRKSKASKAYATDKHGETHFMGVYENETYRTKGYDKFITLGAKKYAVVEDGNLHITVAGVGKKKGAEFIAEQGGIEAFREGFVFPEGRGGGTEAIYNDDPKVKEVEVDGNNIRISRNVVLRETTKTLGITGEYDHILNNPAVYQKIFQIGG